MKKFFITGLTASIPFLALAATQTVPAISSTIPPEVSHKITQPTTVTVTQIESPTHGSPPPNMKSGVQTDMNSKEIHGITLANEWKSSRNLPSRGADGSVVFLYGSTLPSVVCAPLFACNLRLQSGESVTQIDVADNVRWKVTPSTYGNGSTATTVLVIKPTDSGLQTDMVISTDRRMYVVKLLSRLSDWMPLVSFSYPEDVNAAWSEYYSKQKRQKESAIIPTTGQDIAHLDFGYQVKGNASWTPLRVYTDGVKTYIQFPASVKSGSLPSLVVIGADKKEQLVNYRMIGTAFVVDQVLNDAALISGVGKYQQIVQIKRTHR